MVRISLICLNGLGIMVFVMVKYVFFIMIFVLLSFGENLYHLNRYGVMIFVMVKYVLLL
jgi:hypothetical protein